MIKHEIIVDYDIIPGSQEIRTERALRELEELNAKRGERIVFSNQGSVISQKLLDY